MEVQSRRRQRAQADMGLTHEKENRRMERAIEAERQRQVQKRLRRMEIEDSSSYQMIKGIAIAMDKYFLDPIIGFIPVLGDAITSIATLPFIYVSLFKVRSIPLTLAVISNMLIDVLVGLIPFWIGNIADFFHRANLKNFRLIRGFVEDDKEVIHEVNRRAIWMGIFIAILCYLIYLMVRMVQSIIEWIGTLFN